jgi:hypothetical protein
LARVSRRATVAAPIPRGGTFRTRKQRYVVLGMKQQAHVRQRVAHLRALVKAESPHHAMANAHPAQNFLKRTRLRAGAIKHRNLRVRFVAQKSGKLAANELGFADRVLRLEKGQALARADVSLKILP